MCSILNNNYGDAEFFYQIPDYWEIRRVKEFVHLTHGLSVNSSEYVDNSDIILIRMGNIKKGGNIDLTHKNVYLPSKFKNYSKQYILKENDIIIAMTDMSPSLEFLGVPAKLIGLDSNITYILNQRVGKLKFKSHSLNIDFFKYYLMTNLAKNQFKNEGLGTIQGNMSESHFSNLFIVYPPIIIQNKIASYLDRETAKIDQKISILEQKLEKIEEYKQSVIFETVTKGLDDSVAMKDSGVEWIGMIPEHWEVKRVKDVSSIKKGKAVETFLEQSSDMLPCVDTNLLRGRENILYCKEGIKVHPEKVLILWDGANAGELFFNQHLGYLGSTFGIFNISLNNKFWFYYLKGIEQYSRGNLTGMGVPHVDGNVLKQTLAIIPSKKEQQDIVAYLDKITIQLNNKNKIIEKKIRLLKEYKQTIIFEAVTGKIKIGDEDE